jgi:GTP-binding protein
MEIRNIAIIAHVDHGKTTLTDAILAQTGAVSTGVSMDSNSIEQERGITIYSKNVSHCGHSRTRRLWF